MPSFLLLQISFHFFISLVVKKHLSDILTHICALNYATVAHKRLCWIFIFLLLRKLIKKLTSAWSVCDCKRLLGHLYKHKTINDILNKFFQNVNWCPLNSNVLKGKIKFCLQDSGNNWIISFKLWHISGSNTHVQYVCIAWIHRIFIYITGRAFSA